jgi:hypothetical protein
MFTPSNPTNSNKTRTISRDGAITKKLPSKQNKKIYGANNR